MKYEKKSALVIGGDHYNTLDLIRSLGENQIAVYLILIASNKFTFVDKSRYINKFWKINNIEELRGVIEKKGLNEKENLIIYPSSDEACKWCFENKNIFRSSCLPKLQNTHQKICYSDLFNKEKMNLIAESSGFHVPKRTIIKKDNLVENLELSFPLIIKPITGIASNKSDITVVNSIKEYNEKKANLFESYSELIIQEYINGENSFMVEFIGFSNLEKNNITIPGTIEKIREYPLNKGSTSFAKFTNEIKYISIDQFKKFIQNIGYSGIFDVEFIVLNGKAYFIEINFRNGAPSYALTKFGYNIPLMYLEDEILEMDVNRSDYMEKYLMMEFRDLKHVLDKNISLLNWLSSFARSSSFLVLNKKDMKPVFSYLMKG